MSNPGYLTDAELTSVPGGRLANVPAAWWLLTSDELKDAFGFSPAVRSTGLYRTKAEQDRINPGQTVSDHLKGRAADIRNWESYVRVDALKFYRILAKNGWRNIQVNGEPFRSEPWHWVNIKTSKPPVAPEQEQEIDVKLIRRSEGTPEWSLFHPTLRGADDIQRGYVATRDQDIALGWARTWANGLGTEKAEKTEEYKTHQASARVAYDAYQRGLAESAGSGTINNPPVDQSVTHGKLDEILELLKRIFR